MPTSLASQIYEVPTIKLDAAFTGADKRRLPYEAGLMVVQYYDGTDGQCFVQIGEDPTRVYKIEHHKTYEANGYETFYIINLSAQAGCTLEVTIADPGADVSVGSRTAAAATATESTLQSVLTALQSVLAAKQNQATFATGQKTVPTVSAEALAGASVAVPDGFAVVVKALSTNTATVFVGASGVSTATGFELSAGEAVSLFVDDVTDIYCISGTADQKLCYAVEQAS